VQDLFIKVLHVLEKGKLASEDFAKLSNRNIQIAKEHLKENIPENIIERIFDAMGVRYTLENTPDEITLHVEMALELDALRKSNKVPLVLNWKDFQREGLLELTTVSEDYPGLFSEISGILTLNNLNILAARAYTWSNKIAVNVLELSYPPDPLKLHNIYRSVENLLQSAIKEELDVSNLLSKKQSPFKHGQIRFESTGKVEVRVNNIESDFFTIVEVYSPDELGLLYKITKTLFQNGLDIRFAKIGTKGEMAADIFYVKEQMGGKITDESKLEELKKSLIEALSR
jgi:[protein-PII] uridylyltransferase